MAHSKQTKEFLDKIASPRWLKQKKMDMKNFWLSHLSSEGEKRLQNKIQDLKKQMAGAQEPLTEEEVVQTIFERDHINEEEVEEFDLKYPMYFENPSQLIKKFEKLEEDNLALINSQQENEENFTEEETKFIKIREKKEEMIRQARNMIDNLKKQVEELTTKVTQLKEQAKEKKKSSTEDTFDRIESITFNILQFFKDEKELRYSELGVVNRTEAKNKENLLKYLTAIERLLISQIATLKEIPDKELLKKKRNELEGGKKNKQEQNNQTKAKSSKKRGRSRDPTGKMTAADEIVEEQNEYLERMRNKMRRKDMFKSGFAEQEVEVEDNKQDLEELMRQKYFKD